MLTKIMDIDNSQELEDTDWIKAVAEKFLNKNINNLSVKQKKMLREYYLEYMQDGIEPQDAIKKAYTLVLSFEI